MDRYDNISADKFMDEVAKFYIEQENKRVFEELRSAKRITEAVLICNKENAYKIKGRLPNVYILVTELCDKDKIYMVTDEILADNIKANMRLMVDADRGEEE